MTPTLMIRDEGTHWSAVLCFQNDEGTQREMEINNANGSPCLSRWQADKIAANYAARGFEVKEAGR